MKHKRNKCGFTLVELLTTLAVIGVLLGLLIPALNQVSKTATKIKQKAQFYAIGTALEAFRNDYGDYPPSEFKMDINPFATASHHLAEALIGRDGLGFHSRSQFQSDGLADLDGDGTDDDLYEAAGYTTSGGILVTQQDNLAARRGPYLELESANAVKLGDIAPSSTLNKDAYVLVDMYKINKNAATGKEVGMPILYYKANKMNIGNDPDPTASLSWTTNTYCLGDSFCMGLGFIEKNWGNGLFTNDANANASIFYNAIKNPNFTSPPRPYRAESFILHSAGPDGLYGTMDDIFNFETEK